MNIRNLFKKKKLVVGNLYGVQTGTLVGQILCFVKKKDGKYGFLAIPSMKNEWIPEKDVDFGLSSGIIERIEYAPKEVREVSRAKFEENEEPI